MRISIITFRLLGTSLGIFRISRRTMIPNLRGRAGLTSSNLSHYRREKESSLLANCKTSIHSNTAWFSAILAVLT